MSLKLIDPFRKQNRNIGDTNMAMNALTKQDCETIRKIALGLTAEAYAPFHHTRFEKELKRSELVAALIINGDKEIVTKSPVLTGVHARNQRSVNEAVALAPVVAALPEDPRFERFRGLPIIEEAKKRQLVGALLGAGEVATIRDSDVLMNVFNRNPDLMAEHHRATAAKQRAERGGQPSKLAAHVDAVFTAAMNSEKPKPKPRAKPTKPSEPARTAASFMKMQMSE